MRIIVAIFALTVSLPAFADSPLDFPAGPGQWLMTSEEKKEWRGVKNETRAQELVDLFFVRRDPTPGTFANEFRDEFHARVDFTDRNFREGNRRGSLTERGRVIMVLGFPSDMGEEAGKRSSQYMSGESSSLDPTGGRAQAGRSVWNYEYKEAIKYGMPKIEVVFIHDGMNGRVRRDTHRNDFISALAPAIQAYIRTPGLTEVPEWARRELKLAPMQEAPAAEEVKAMLDAPLPDAPPVASVPADAAAPKVPAAARPPSVGKLTLVADAFALEPQNGSDPFASLKSLTDFRRDGELGWVAEYCSGNLAPLSSVEVTLKISGLINGERVNFNAPPEELVPDSIKASPGCYLVRGAVPLMDMDPASYALFVKIGQYNLTKDFRVIE